MKCLYITFVFLLVSLQAYTQTCEVNETSSKAKVVLESTRKQISVIDKVLKGEDVTGFSIYSYFGRDFKIEETDNRIKKLESILKDNNGVTIENTSLIGCLDKLKMTQQKTELEQIFKQLIKSKISLLSKNKVLGDSIRVTGMTEVELPTIKDAIGEDSKNARNEKALLEDKLIRNEKDSLKEKDNNRRNVLDYENELTKIKIELLSSRIKINANLEDKIKYFEKIASELKTLGSVSDSDDEELKLQKFSKVEKLWKSLLNENYYELFNNRETLNLPKIPSELSLKEPSVKLEKAQQLRLDLLNLKREIIKNYSEKRTQELKLLNQLVVSSNKVRESFFKNLSSTQLSSTFFSLDFFGKLKDEVLSSPYRVLSFIYSKYLFVSEQLSLGKEGYVKLFYILLILITALFSIYILQMLFKKTEHVVNLFFEHLIKSKRRSYIIQKSFVVWSKLKDSTLFILWIMVISFVQKYEYFKDVYILLSLAKIYFISHFIKLLTTVFLGNISKLDVGSFSDFKLKANLTSNKFKNIVMFYFVTMLFIEITVGKVYLYSLINMFVIIYSFILLIKESSKWELELKKYSEKMFSGVIVEKFSLFAGFLPLPLKSFLNLLFIVVLLVFDFFISLTENLEISKKISANVFKKQIEGIEAEDGAKTRISDEYRGLFSLKSLENSDEYVYSSTGIENSIEKELKEWCDDISDEHSLVVYGDKGIGKTTLLKQVGERVSQNDNVDIVYAKMPSKTVSISDLEKFISKLFPNVSFESGFNIYEIDNTLTKKTMIVIDECQNIFLSQNGGFAAYYYFVNLINLNTKNIFWVMSFNKYSWLYLDRAFGRTQYFRNVFELKGWSDTKIKELIMKRHRKSKFKLSYDLLISATRSQDEIDKYSSIESKFFKLLWELSRGNPRTALYLWGTALSRKNNLILNVNIPKEVDLAGIEKTPDDLLFVITHILKHENLLSHEIETTTNLPKGIVRNAIKLGLEKKFIFKDDRDRYMVDITTQYGLIKFLKVKNFIYGN